MLPTIQQFKLSDKERENLLQQVLKNWNQDSWDMTPRSNAMTRWIRLWRAATDDNPFPAQEKSNFHIPLVLWQILNKVAKEFSMIFGEDAEIVVRPVGDTDAKRIEKVRKWMNYRVAALEIKRKYYDYNTFKQIYGTSIAFCPWVQRKRTIKHFKTVNDVVYDDTIEPNTGLPVKVPRQVPRQVEEVKEMIDFEGIDLIPENIEDWAVPKAGGPSLEDKDHFCRRLRLTVDQILDLRDDGTLDADIFTPEFIEDLYRIADQTKTNYQAGADAGKQVRMERDAQAGEPSYPLGSESRIVVYNWFGRYRRDKKERAEQVVAFVIPNLNKLIGAVKLVDKYPDGRIPFIKGELIRDPNRFWGIGIPELLESINNEMDMHHNIVTDAGSMTVGPVIFYKPMSGFVPDKFKYEPQTCVPVNDPKNDVNAVMLGQINLAAYAALMPQLLAMAERITGLTESQLGRQFSGPNAPRTVGQQVLLQTESNQRLALDLELERDTVRQFLRRVWEYDKRFLPKPLFFRVTEEDPGDVLTEEDMQGDYDFDIGPPTAASSRSTLTQEMLQAYAMIAQDPIAMQNPGLKLAFMRKILIRLHQGDLVSYLPDAKDMVPPQSADSENTRMLQGEDVQVHPGDNHVEHIAKHKYLVERIQNWEGQVPGIATVMDLHGTISRASAHIAEHEKAESTQGGSVRMPMNAPPQPAGQMFGGPSNQQPQGGGMAAAPQANPAQGQLAGLLNSGGLNIA